MDVATASGAGVGVAGLQCCCCCCCCFLERAEGGLPAGCCGATAAAAAHARCPSADMGLAAAAPLQPAPGPAQSDPGSTFTRTMAADCGDSGCVWCCCCCSWTCCATAAAAAAGLDGSPVPVPAAARPVQARRAVCEDKRPVVAAAAWRWSRHTVVLPLLPLPFAIPTSYSWL